NADSLMQHAIGIFESQRDLSRRACGFSRIGNAPMRGHRLARPYRTGLARRVIADREHKIERRGPPRREIGPPLRTESRCIKAETLQEPNGFRVDAPLGLAPRAVGAEFPCAQLV